MVALVLMSEPVGHLGQPSASPRARAFPGRGFGARGPQDFRHRRREVTPGPSLSGPPGHRAGSGRLSGPGGPTSTAVKARGGTSGRRALIPGACPDSRQTGSRVAAAHDVNLRNGLMRSGLHLLKDLREGFHLIGPGFPPCGERQQNLHPLTQMLE